MEGHMREDPLEAGKVIRRHACLTERPVGRWPGEGSRSGQRRGELSFPLFSHSAPSAHVAYGDTYFSRIYCCSHFTARTGELSQVSICPGGKVRVQECYRQRSAASLLLTHTQPLCVTLKPVSVPHPNMAGTLLSSELWLRRDDSIYFIKRIPSAYSEWLTLHEERIQGTYVYKRVEMIWF